MKQHVITKALAISIIVLFVGTSIVSSTNENQRSLQTTEKQHQANSQTSNENSLIRGYVYDNSTSNPLENVHVELSWEDAQGNYGYNDTSTNTAGFYQFSIAASNFNLYFDYTGYFSENSPMMTIGENEIRWYNISLIPVPPQTVHFQGYITDNSSGEPINGAGVSIDWHDSAGHYWSNYTMSNASGFYYVGVIPGTTYVYAYQDNYFSFNSQEYNTQNNATIWLNISLIPFPPASAIVCGYVTDAQTGDFIPNAQIDLYCNTDQGSWDNTTSTNDLGFYSIGSIPGHIQLHAYAYNYLPPPSINFDITENETLWINVTMDYQPEETSLVKGYVVDNETYAAVRNAFVQFDWKDEIGHFYSKYTFTDQTGYYSIKTPPGTLQMMITANGYTNQQKSWFHIGDYTESWWNTSIQPEITMKITKPKPGIYIMNRLMFPILTTFISHSLSKFKPLIIGPIEITANITKSTIGCNRVDFYIDNTYRWTDTKAPFTYYWKTISFSKHVIRVVAYDNAGPCTIETLTVHKIL